MFDSLEAIASAPNLIREQWLPLEIAVREIVTFERRFGLKHLLLACHAALPLILTPESLNLIHYNFLDSENIPWIAEMDFLLSPLCRPIDDDLFEVEPSVRDVLLVELEERFSRRRLVDISEFLLIYLDKKQRWKQSFNASHTQRWIALSYIDPDQVIREMTDILQRSLLLEEDHAFDVSDQLQIATMLEIMAEPLERTSLQAEHHYLVHDSRVLSQMLYGDEETLRQDVAQAISNGMDRERIITLLSPNMLKWLANRTSESTKSLQKDKEAARKNVPTPPNTLDPTEVGTDLDLLLPKQIFIDHARNKIPSFDEDLVSHAWDFSKEAHGNQKRVDREAYFSHPVSVASILLDVPCDSTTIAAALLHDVVEDTGVGILTIEENFGANIASLVDGVTKLASLDGMHKLTRESMTKLFIAIVKDPRVALLKLADCIYNLQTLGALSEEHRRRKVKASLEVYAPLADALGLDIFRRRIEDLAFRHLEPDTYRGLERKLKEKWEELSDLREVVIEVIEDELEKAQIEGAIYARMKEPYSIYRKMKNMGLTFEQIEDILGFRIIVNDTSDCYSVVSILQHLGIIVNLYDYIAQPPHNRGLQGLQTVLSLQSENILIEVQIRSVSMHHLAEQVSTTQWLHRDSGSAPDKALVQKMNSLREALGVLAGERDISLEEFRENILGPYIIVFTPQGMPISLPEGSTPIDFAYSIHTELGHECHSAKVNGKSVPLDYKLADGQTVEIIRVKGSKPNLDWIRDDKVKSNRARQKINKYFRDQGRSEKIAYGRNFLQKYLKILHDVQIGMQDLLEDFVRLKFIRFPIEEHLYIALAEMQIPPERFNKMLGEIVIKRYLAKRNLASSNESIDNLVKWFTTANMLPTSSKEALFQAVVDGKISIRHLNQALQKLIVPTPEQQNTDSLRKLSKSRSVSQDLLFHTGQCCYPVPGDSIVGFVTAGRGLTIHRTICPEVLIPKRRDRIIAYTWKELGDFRGTMFSGKLLLVLATSDPKVYRKLEEVITRADGIIRELRPMDNSKRPIRISLIIDVWDTGHLQNILTKLREINDVIEARRSLDDESNA